MAMIEEKTVSRIPSISPNANTNDDEDKPQPTSTEDNENAEEDEEEEEEESNITTSEPQPDSTDSPNPEESLSPSNFESKSVTTTGTPKKHKSKSKSAFSRPSRTSPPTLTTEIFYKKLVKLHINTLPATNYPTKPTSQPTFALYEEGIIYIKGTPYAILGADSDYYKVKQSDDGNTWDPVDGKKNKDEEKDKAEAEAVNKAEEEHTEELLKLASGNAVYSADMVSAGENAARKMAFFTVLGAGIIVIGLLVFFQVIGPHE
ncbi:hypothetical protein AA313_de0202299 [Arthrobotrys entomopaga]|nr:hypothetical protein AA313_de0202299 [Arthrobotrys entomopaga]